MTMMTMPTASRLGVPVLRKKSEKYSMVSIKKLITHCFKKGATKFLVKLYQKSWPLSIDTTSCAREVNLWCSNFLKKSLKAQSMCSRSMPIDAISMC